MSIFDFGIFFFFLFVFLGNFANAEHNQGGNRRRTGQNEVMRKLKQFLISQKKTKKTIDCDLFHLRTLCGDVCDHDTPLDDIGWNEGGTSVGEACRYAPLVRKNIKCDTMFLDLERRRHKVILFPSTQKKEMSLPESYLI